MAAWLLRRLASSASVRSVAAPCALSRPSLCRPAVLGGVTVYAVTTLSNNVKSRSVLCHFCHVWCFALPASPLLCPPGAARSRGNARLAAPVRLFFHPARAYSIRVRVVVLCSCLRRGVFLSFSARPRAHRPFAGKCSLGGALASFCPCTNGVKESKCCWWFVGAVFCRPHVGSARCQSLTTLPAVRLSNPAEITTMSRTQNHYTCHALVATRGRNLITYPHRTACKQV